MGCVDLIRHLARAGLKLTADGERLIVTPAARLTDELRALIRDQKGELMRSLASASAPSAVAGQGLAGDDDRITCTGCRHFRVVAKRCSNHVRAGMPFDLAPEVTTLPQRCPGYAALPPAGEVQPGCIGPMPKESATASTPGPFPKESVL